MVEALKTTPYPKVVVDHGRKAALQLVGEQWLQFLIALVIANPVDPKHKVCCYKCKCSHEVHMSEDDYPGYCKIGIAGIECQPWSAISTTKGFLMAMATFSSVVWVFRCCCWPVTHEGESVHVVVVVLVDDFKY